MARAVVSLAGACLLLLLVQAHEGTAGEALVFIDVVGAPGDGERALAHGAG